MLYGILDIPKDAAGEMEEIEMTVRYLAPVRSEDLVAEGWISRRGKRVVFCEVEVRTASAVKVAAGNLIYIVGSPPSGE